MEDLASTVRPSFPIKEEWGGHGRGRYVVSSRPVKRGEVVLEALPYALAPKLASVTCARCYRFCPPAAAAAGQSSDQSGGAEGESKFQSDGEDGSDSEDVITDRANCKREGLQTTPLRPCGRCGAAYYCSAEEEAADRRLHELECAAWRRVREAGASMGLSEGEQAELRLVFRIAARHHLSSLDRRFDDDGEGDDDRENEDPRSQRIEGMHQLAGPTFEDVQRLCSNRERRPLEEMTFWRKVVQKVVAPLVAEEEATGRGVQWSKYDFVELICKNLCNGFGLRGAGGQCYAYGVYPAASYFNHSCYPNICRIEQDVTGCPETKDTGASYDAGPSPCNSRQRFVALVDIPAGHEVCLSYIDASKPTEHRRLALSTIYFFHCMCARCEGKANNGSRNRGSRPSNQQHKGNKKDDYVQRFVCRDCTKTNGRGVLYPFSGTHDRCNLCHRLVARTKGKPAAGPSLLSPTGKCI